MSSHLQIRQLCLVQILPQLDQKPSTVELYITDLGNTLKTLFLSKQIHIYLKQNTGKMNYKFWCYVFVSLFNYNSTCHHVSVGEWHETGADREMERDSPASWLRSDLRIMCLKKLSRSYSQTPCFFYYSPNLLFLIQCHQLFSICSSSASTSFWQDRFKQIKLTVSLIDLISMIRNTCASNLSHKKG